MSKFDSRAKAITLTALVASTAIVTYASQDNSKSTDENVETAKLIIDKVDSDTVKVSVGNVNNSAKAFQLSLAINGNAKFKENEIDWLSEPATTGSTLSSDVKLSNDKKTIDIFVASDSELKRNGSTMEICEIDLEKDSVFKSDKYSIVPNTKDENLPYKSVDTNNKSLEVADMIYDTDNVLSFNTAPTIKLKTAVTLPEVHNGDTTQNINQPVVDATNNIITISEGYEFDAKSFIDVNDVDEDLTTDDVVVTDDSGKEITGVESNLKSGTYERNYTVTDSAGDSATLKVSVVVLPEVWDTNPTITGVPESKITIYTGDIFDPFKPDGKTSIVAKDAKNNNIEVTLSIVAEDTSNTTQSTLSNALDINEAGNYILTYTAKDRFDNTTTQSLNLEVIQDNAPVINGLDDVLIDSGTEFNELAGVTVMDDNKPLTEKDIKVSGKVNTNIPGEYKLVYEVSDGRNTTRRQRKVTVNGAPTISGDLSYIIVKNGENISDEEILSGITAVDDIDEQVASLVVNRENLNISTDGKYTVTITATDSRNLTSSVKRDIIVTSKSIVDLPDSGNGLSKENSIKKQVIDGEIISTINQRLSDLTKDNEVTLSKTTVLENVVYSIKVTPNQIAFTETANEYFVDITVPKDIDSEGGIVITKHETVKISSISVSGNQGEMKIGEERKLNTTVAPENADNKELLWSSTNNDVVSIVPSEDSQSATIKALKKGTSTIRVIATDGSAQYEELVVQVGEQPKEDTEAPVFDYKGKTDIVLANGMKFETPLVTASDNVDTGIDVNVSIIDSNKLNIEKIDTTVAGEYKIIYTAKDKSNNKAELVINVTVKEAISGVEVGVGNATSEIQALEIKIPDSIEALNTLLDSIKKDGYEPKIYGKPVVDEVKNEIIYTIKMYKKQNLFAKLFRLNDNEEVYYLKLTLKNTNEFTTIMNSIEQEDKPSSGGGGITQKPPTTEFKDIKNHWAESTINQFVNKGYIEGYEDKTFRPNNSMTRAEFVKIVNKVFGFKNKGNESFKDVEEGQWFYDDICIGIKAGYIKGKSKDIFAPNDKITRQEVAMILTNIKNNKDENLDKLNLFKDGKETADWAKSSIEGAIEAGYLEGYEDKTIRSKGNITRAEAITMLSRIK